MKKTTSLFRAVFLMVTGIIIILVFVVRHFSQADTYSPLARLRTLYIGLAYYSEDSEGKSDKSRFPPSLQDLVNPNIMTEKTLNDLTNGVDITYYKPTAQSPDDFVILKFNGKNGYGICTLDGKVSSHPFKKP